MSHQASPPPIGWAIAGNSQNSNPNEDMDSDDVTSTPGGQAYNYYTSDSDSEQQTKNNYANTDPFADLPDPVPVPFGNTSSNSHGYSASANPSSPKGGGYQKPQQNFYPKPSSYNHQHKSNQNQGYTSFGEPNPTNHHPKSNASKYPNSSQSQQMQPPSRLVTNPRDLDIFGKFDLLKPAEQKFKMIVKYVRNSHGLKEQQGDVWVHNVYELDNGLWKSFINSIKKDVSGNSTGEQMLLWYKTTPGGIQRLAQKQKGCAAFYDRICRAFPQNPRDIQAPLRQLIILCAVSLGKVQKDRNGFKHWSKIGQLPVGFNSVKGMGRLCPDWSENVYDDTFTMPCGRTKQHQGYKSYDIDFNEYMVFNPKRITVKYAVDLEIRPFSSRQSGVEKGAIGSQKGKR